MIEITKKNIIRCLLVLLFCAGIISVVILANNHFTQQTATKTTYQQFEQEYLSADKNFNPAGYTKLLDLSKSYRSISFPDNNFSKKQNDNFENDILQPVNRKIAFTDENAEVLVVITYIFTEGTFDSNIITINTLPSNVLELLPQDKQETIPLSFDFIITNNSCLILLECTSLSTDAQDNNDYFYSQLKLFYKAYTDYLLESNEKVTLAP